MEVPQISSLMNPKKIDLSLLPTISTSTLITQINLPKFPFPSKLFRSGEVSISTRGQAASKSTSTAGGRTLGQYVATLAKNRKKEKKEKMEKVEEYSTPISK